ncbi:cytosine permease [Mycolicibacterium neworleansense]|uniref:Cytosine permease n=1 Tax=Mycolicibacterium neworleansense TaxID=146018 RepID=A0A0H5RVA5_9MYCO|nr:cytosine permease [Mycolicibacterium neworleansense]MCV7360677.1 cytosine permease [Mycolicibacterium neworleansense]CRZ17706.1 cytosine permease [Mycolicibacterium neworleansense]
MDTAPSALGEEYENEPVPLSARKSLFSVSAVWVGFPMIMTSAVFAGIVVYNLGFGTGMAAILVGDLVLMAYVGTLSYLAGRSGKNFALTAADTFGTKGFRVVSAFLSALVIGWFAFQTGMVGSTLNLSMGWSAPWITLLAGVLFVALTFVGIRAISWIGVVASALFIPLGVVAVALAAADGGIGSALSYGGGAGAGAFSFGVAVTMVFACFADSGTMTADFTRWARNGKEGALAAFAAFPVAYFIAQLVGALVVALGAAAAADTAGGDFLHVLVSAGGILVPLAIVFVFVNLGSVCAHCLYNGAVGFGNITGKTMRQLTIVLGVVGTVAAVAGIWSYFATWLNILGVLVPPIGIVLILDQLVFAGRRVASGAGMYWKPFAAWAIGAGGALLTHFYAPQLSDAVVAMVVGGLAFTALAYLPVRAAQPVLVGETA